MYMINNLLAENQAKIAELEEKLEASDVKSTKLQRMVNKLTSDLKKKNKENLKQCNVKMLLNIIIKNLKIHLL